MRTSLLISSLVLAVAGLCLQAASAGAADRVYWGNAGGNSISHADLTGGGGGDISISGVTVDHPEGLAIDSAAGRIYWTNREGTSFSIRFANLDGSGGGTLDTAPAPVLEPHGLAIDPALGRIYWVNFPENAVYFANLDGSGGGELDTTGAVVETPVGLAVYPAQNRVYWANFEDSTHPIAFANLDGTGGGGSLDLTGSFVDMPEGIAIDPITNRVYWTNRESIGFASANGGNGGEVDTETPLNDAPEGLAIDPFRKTIYWGDTVFDTIGTTSLIPGGPASHMDTVGATADDPTYPVLLEDPRNVVPPTAELARIPRTAEAHIPERHAEVLDCSPGQWAPDVIESFLYRAPQKITFQWLRNDQPLAGATASRIDANLVGNYSCIVTATNGAGSTSVASTGSFPIVAGMKLRKVKLNRRKGTAKVYVGTSGAGLVGLAGRSLKPKMQEVSNFSATLVVRSKGKAKSRLQETGKSKVRVKVSFTPTDAQAITRTKSITLRLAGR